MGAFDTTYAAGMAMGLGRARTVALPLVLFLPIQVFEVELSYFMGLFSSVLALAGLAWLLIASIVVLIRVVRDHRDPGALLTGVFACACMSYFWLGPTSMDWFLIRHESGLLEEVRVLHSGSGSQGGRSSYGRWVHRYGDPRAVYWVHWDSGLGEYGLLWFPEAMSESDVKAAFSSVLWAEHIRGPWWGVQRT